MNTLLKYFMDTDKNVRERAGFRLPAIVPIVFYNGQDRWTAATRMKDYQQNGDIFGDYILNLEYYLVDLAEIEEEYILSTNTVLDNIMYCDKNRKKLELLAAIRAAYSRVRELGLQEQEEFRNWAKYILLSVCEYKEAVAEEVLNWIGNEEDNMAFQYNIIRIFEEERAEVREEGREEGKTEAITEAIVDLLEDISNVPEQLKKMLFAQQDLATLRKWHKLAARARTIEEFEHQISVGMHRYS